MRETRGDLAFLFGIKRGMNKGNGSGEFKAIRDFGGGKTRLHRDDRSAGKHAGNMRRDPFV